MSDVVAPYPYLWGTPLEERLATFDQALALLRQADEEALRLLADVRGLAHLVDWSADAADAFRAAVSAWESELVQLTAAIQAVIDQICLDRRVAEAAG
ncbi:hypothetical protein OHB93_09965 [Microbacterium sp. No. 7]|uniref:hypothetical protein n=1 Tax=Microbacterium sp. No. 7 TaxID=1714373 RepID=UPI0030092EC3